MDASAPMTLPVFDLAAIKKAAAAQLLLDTVRDALIAHAEGRTTVPPPLHLDFPEADGGVDGQQSPGHRGA
jgi:ornithine cyclodeaminase/alanine dehydrogenase-like protein (mu-crystallin family)